MEEKELKEIVESILDPLKEKHQGFMQNILVTVETAFLAGIDVGKELNNQNK